MATPIDPPHEQVVTNRAFVHGICVGIAIAAVVLQIVLADAVRDLVLMYRDLGSPQHYPLGTRITMSPIWLWGTPAAGAAMITALIAARPRRLALYVLVAAMLLMVAAATWVLPRSPLSELAGNISAD